jgi:iron(II)-dependent oxidoreductase
MSTAQRSLSVRHQVLDLFSDSRSKSDSLFQLIRRDSLHERTIPERHRFIFYVGHLEAFDWNLLRERLGIARFDPELDQLFAFGIDPVDGALPSDQPQDWPAVDAVRRYVGKIRTALDEKLSDALDSHAATDGTFSLSTLLQVAIEHRLMHLETLAYMLHQLPIDKKVHQIVPQSRATPRVTPRIVEIPGGVAKLGLPRREGIFGWDNEYEEHEVTVARFEMDQFMVTNGQYLEFMTAGGYDSRPYWNNDDWNWKTTHGVSHPVFWKKAGDSWVYRGMFDEVALPLDWPVYVSHAEAAAYSRWAGKDLPTEAEWHRAAYGSTQERVRTYPWGDAPPEARFGNFDFQRWDPQPVNAFPDGRSAFDVYGMLGNGWEWTSTVFAPFPGFQAFPFYSGYSANFFDGQHFVIKGGSARTAACMLRPTFRNWFQPHYQYVYAGFRCVRR